MRYFFVFFRGNLLVQSKDRVTQNRTISGWFRQAFGTTTYSLIGFPFIGSSNEAPFMAMSSFRLSSDTRTNRSSPNSPANMFPLTNADMFPNIGRTVMRESSGKMDLKNSLEFSSERGIFIQWHQNERQANLGTSERLRPLQRGRWLAFGMRRYV